MIKTNHYQSRIQQRGVLQSTVDLAIAYGSKWGDKFILGKKQLRVVLAELDQLRKQVLKAVDQGGVVAVESEGCLITAYRLDSFSKSLAHGKSTWITTYRGYLFLLIRKTMKNWRVFRNQDFLQAF